MSTRSELCMLINDIRLDFGDGRGTIAEVADRVEEIVRRMVFAEEAVSEDAARAALKALGYELIPPRATGEALPAEIVRIDRYTVLINGQRVQADEHQERRLRAMTPEQQRRFLSIFGADR